MELRPAELEVVDPYIPFSHSLYNAFAEEVRKLLKERWPTIYVEESELRSLIHQT